MTKVEQSFEQISPLLDDAVMAIASMNLAPYEHAALASMTVFHLSMGTALAMMRCDPDEKIPDSEQQRIIELLTKQKREVEEVLQAATERFMSGRALS